MTAGSPRSSASPPEPRLSGCPRALAESRAASGSGEGPAAPVYNPAAPSERWLCRGSQLAACLRTLRTVAACDTAFSRRRSSGDIAESLFSLTPPPTSLPLHRSPFPAPSYPSRNLLRVLLVAREGGGRRRRRRWSVIRRAP